jgi:hypothetical protein
LRDHKHHECCENYLHKNHACINTCTSASRTKPEQVEEQVRRIKSRWTEDLHKPHECCEITNTMSVANIIFTNTIRASTSAQVQAAQSPNTRQKSPNERHKYKRDESHRNTSNEAQVAQVTPSCASTTTRQASYSIKLPKFISSSNLSRKPRCGGGYSLFIHPPKGRVK